MSSRGKSRERESVLHRLSGDPGSSLGGRVRHHGSRVLLVVLLAAFVALAFPPVNGMDVERYTLGMVAPEDVIADVPFDVPKTATELERDRRSAMEAVPPTFDFTPDLADTVATRMRDFFSQIDGAAVAGDTSRVREILEERQISPTARQLQYLLDEDTRDTFRSAAVRAATEILPQGVADASRMVDLTAGSVTLRRGDDEEVADPSSILTSRDFFARAVALLPDELPPEARDLFRLILIHHVQFTLELNVVATERDREQAAASVPTTKNQVLQGQAIVREADPIGPATLERLRAYEEELQARGILEREGVAVGALVGAWLLNIGLISIFGLLLFFNRPKVYANFRWLLLIALLSAAYFGAGIAIDRGGLAPEWLPIAFVALPVAVLWDTRMSLFLVLILAAITGTLPPFSDYGFVLALIAAGSAAAMSVRAVRRRSETWVSIALTALGAVVMLLSYALATGGGLTGALQSGAVFAGNATVSALLAMGFLWVFELFTGITTDQTLLEWADPTRPLLRRLSMEAPGTYAHTINVANLAEAAASEIGANGLLCRVGVLYHDVGKMLKPHYFVENQPEGRNPHDKLKPETSATIVREHVTEGARLAREANVPNVVLDFILEHHGTQKIGFFYEKALEGTDGDVDLTRYSYPGPKPRSKETAIVMLADSCESAGRAMREPTVERVKTLIDSIVAAKIADGQLDDAPLTLAEVARAKEQFAKILGGVSHRRIEYPATKHLTDAAKAEKPAGEAPDNDAAVAAGGADEPDRSADAKLGP
ncbi:MAG: HDIG domain-containing protein [Gemmatimonadota bacterium]|nr:HDIG domain-containing protein [Gemmatimonadota bacterium]